MGSVLTSHLRATYGAAVNRNGLSDSHQLQTWHSELADPQFTTVYAENQTGRRECCDSAEMLTANWETLQSHVTSWNKLTGVIIATHGLCLFRACQLIAHLLLNLCARNTNPSLGWCQSCFSNFESVPQDRSLGAAMTRYHSMGRPLGAVMTVTPAWLHLRTSHT